MKFDKWLHPRNEHGDFDPHRMVSGAYTINITDNAYVAYFVNHHPVVVELIGYGATFAEAVQVCTDHHELTKRAW